MYLLGYVAIGTVKREKMGKKQKKSYWCSSMGGGVRSSGCYDCVWFELFSVVESLQVGVKANERNVVKPVSRREEQRDDVNTYVVMYLDVTCFGQERAVWIFVGRGRKSWNCFCCFKFESLILDTVCDTPYFLRSPSSLFSCRQKSHEKA